jgi:hypothetical protein
MEGGFISHFHLLLWRLMLYLNSFVFSFGGTTVWTQGLAFVRQGLHHLIHTSSHFFALAIFQIESLMFFGGPWISIFLPTLLHSWEYRHLSPCLAYLYIVLCVCGTGV